MSKVKWRTLVTWSPARRGRCWWPRGPGAGRRGGQGRGAWRGRASAGGPGSGCRGAARSRAGVTLSSTHHCPYNKIAYWYLTNLPGHCHGCKSVWNFSSEMQFFKGFPSHYHVFWVCTVRPLIFGRNWWQILPSLNPKSGSYDVIADFQWIWNISSDKTLQNNKMTHSQ